jgi:hypothetical protein
MRKGRWKNAPWQVSGSTLRRHREQWAGIGLLAQVHAVLIGMLRGDPTLILDGCAVRAKRGGDLTDPTDRGKRGTKYHIATTGDDVPVACAATAANVNDTLVFEQLFLAAFAVMARIRTGFADKGYDAEHHRDLCREFGAEPCIPNRGQPHGSGLGSRAQQCLGPREQAPRSAVPPAAAIATPEHWWPITAATPSVISLRAARP